MPVLGFRRRSSAVEKYARRGIPSLATIAVNLALNSGIR